MWRRVLFQTAMVLVLTGTSALALEWQSEVGVINFTQNPMTGILTGFSANGQQVYQNNKIALPGFGRMELDVARDTTNRTGKIRYMRLDIASGQAVGYQKFFKQGMYRVGLEAKPRAVQGSLYVPHIDSSVTERWWTAIALLNTTQFDKYVHFDFDTGQRGSILLGPGHQRAVTIASLFDGMKQPNINSARIDDGDGLVGLVLFGQDSEDAAGDDLLSGITVGGIPQAITSQGNQTTRRLVFPHVDNTKCPGEDDPGYDETCVNWWTGYSIYAPNQITKRVYSSSTPGQMIGDPKDLHLPSRFIAVEETVGAGWFSVEAPFDVIGLELFGNRDLAGFSVVNIETDTGVFPKIERNGWTGIALVNPSDVSATVTLDARNNSGASIATKTHQIPPKTKLVDVVQKLFDADISSATYIRFTSSLPLVGFQLNGSQGDTMLDAIPALGSAETLGNQNLYFPHIDY